MMELLVVSSTPSLQVSNSAHAAHAEQNWFEMNGDRFYSNLQDAAEALQSNGYAAHFNKGKFINYQGGDVIHSLSALPFDLL